MGIWSYTYDENGNLHTQTDAMSQVITFTYDGLNRVTSKTYSPSPGNPMGYDSSHKHAVDYVNYNGTNYNYDYDANGNMTQGYDFSNLASIQVRTVTYNVDNMPTSIYHGSGTTASLLYDGSGARAKKTVTGGSSSTTYYVGAHFEVKDGLPLNISLPGTSGWPRSREARSLISIRTTWEAPLS